MYSDTIAFAEALNGRWGKVYINILFEVSIRNAVIGGQSGYVCKWVTSLLKQVCSPNYTRAVEFFYRNNLSVKM